VAVSSVLEEENSNFIERGRLFYATASLLHFQTCVRVIEAGNGYTVAVLRRRNWFKMLDAFGSGRWTLSNY